MTRPEITIHGVVRVKTSIRHNVGYSVRTITIQNTEGEILELVLFNQSEKAKIPVRHVNA